MNRFLQNTQEFYAGLNQNSNSRKQIRLRELIFVINTAPFMNIAEKNQLIKTLYFFNEHMIRNLRNSLIRQGIRYFQEKNH